MDLTIVFRCSDDPRVMNLISSVDVEVAIVGAVTENSSIMKELDVRGIPYVVVPKGNLANSTNCALNLVCTSKVLLVDSDCTFYRGAIERMYSLSANADIVRPRVVFKKRGLTSWFAALVRRFEYDNEKNIFEPGLLLSLTSTLNALGSPLFRTCAPFTPDGEFSSRAIRSNFKVLTDLAPTIRHDSINIRQQLYAHYRYGISDATCSIHCGRMALREFFTAVPSRYRLLFTRHIPALLPTILCDLIYVIGQLVCLLKYRLAGRPKPSTRPVYDKLSES